jgi:hypothetical protein
MREANKETVMRHFTVLFTVLALSSVAGCAAQNAASATPGTRDTAVRAETRRISNARAYSAEEVVSVPLSDAERIRRATSF